LNKKHRLAESIFSMVVAEALASWILLFGFIKRVV